MSTADTRLAWSFVALVTLVLFLHFSFEHKSLRDDRVIIMNQEKVIKNEDSIIKLLNRK